MKVYQQIRNGRIAITTMALLFLITRIVAQSCPLNVDFEKGDFSSWTTFTGSVSSSTGRNLITLNTTAGPEAGRHQILSRATQSTLTDYYGGFPVVCPNGSRFSVKLGDSTGGSQAEGLSYEFTIPANRDSFSLTYHYAVVFEEPNHIPSAQPRLEVEMTNVTDNQAIGCHTFTYFPNGSSLPGFFRSSRITDVPVWCKNWTTVSIDLHGNAGKTIRLFFKTADCAFLQHFGYAYIDIDESCNGELTGAAYCPGDTAINLAAPYGFQSYKWFNSSFSQVLGNQQMLTLQPKPPAGSVLAVEIIPYLGYGCKDTVYTRLADTLTVTAKAGPDAIYCAPQPVLIGENARPGIRYQWTPSAGLSDTAVANPLASPAVTTQYILTATSAGGGCTHSDTVIITPAIIDPLFQLIGKSDVCSNSGDSAVLTLSTPDRFQWYRNAIPVSGTQLPRYHITQSGTYYASITNQSGCRLTTPPVTINIDRPIPGIQYPAEYTFINMPLTLQARTIGNAVVWKPSALLNNPLSFAPSFRSSSEVIQKYLISIITPGGCHTTDTQFVAALKEIKVLVPTAFTPNGDRLNDKLFPVTYGIAEKYAFKIINRWGQEMYSAPAGHPGWDGNFKGIRQPAGVYVWYFSGLGIDGKKYFRKGVATLIR